MDHALAMRSLQSFANLDGDAQQLRSGHGTLLDALGKGLALQVLHDEIIRAVLPSDIVERADIRMVEAGNCAGFALEALTNFGRISQMKRQYFQRNSAVEPCITRAVHFAHSTGTDRRDHFVGPEACSGSECHWRGLYASRVEQQGTKLRAVYEGSESWRAPCRTATA